MQFRQRHWKVVAERPKLFAQGREKIKKIKLFGEKAIPQIVSLDM